MRLDIEEKRSSACDPEKQLYLLATTNGTKTT